MPLGGRARHDDRMTAAAGRALIALLADVVAEADSAGADQVMARLAELSGPGWLRLDELARRPYWGQSPFDRVADWRPLLTAGSDPVSLVAASMCRDGKVREAAVTILAERRAPVASAALAVRVADWVPQVSSAASAAVTARTGPGDAAAIIPVFLALRQRTRGRQAVASYLASLADGPAATLEALAASHLRSCRLWAMEAQAARNLLRADILADRAMRDRDPVVALWCARSLTGPSGELPAGTGPRLLASARAGVRAFAAGHLTDDQLTVPGLRELLLDRSAAVRSVARWRWKRRWGDPAPVYRLVLAGASQARHIAAALHGLDEDDDNSLPAAAVPFLAHPSPRVRRAAAQAVAHHTDPDTVVEHLVPLLLDNSGKVAAAALRQVRGHALPASALASIDAAGTPCSRRVALSLRQHSGTWNRIHADLAAINGQDPGLAEAARADLLAWLQHGAATSYGKPDARQATEIARLLATPKLSDQQRRQVAFVADIRTLTAGSQPGRTPAHPRGRHGQ